MFDRFVARDSELKGMEGDSARGKEKNSFRIMESKNESLKRSPQRNDDDFRLKILEGDNKSSAQNVFTSPYSARQHPSSDILALNKLTPPTNSGHRHKTKPKDLEKLITLYSLNPGEKDSTLKKCFEYSSMKLFVVKVPQLCDSDESDDCQRRGLFAGVHRRLERQAQR